MSIELLTNLISLYFGLQVQGTVRLNKSLGFLHVILWWQAFEKNKEAWMLNANSLWLRQCQLQGLKIFAALAQKTQFNSKAMLFLTDEETIAL